MELQNHVIRTADSAGLVEICPGAIIYLISNCSAFNTTAHLRTTSPDAPFEGKDTEVPFLGTCKTNAAKNSEASDGVGDCEANDTVLSTPEIGWKGIQCDGLRGR